MAGMKRNPAKRETEASLPDFDNDKYYRVRFSRTVKWAGRDLPAGAYVVVLGRVAGELRENIRDGSEVPS